MEGGSVTFPNPFCVYCLVWIAFGRRNQLPLDGMSIGMHCTSEPAVRPAPVPRADSTGGLDLDRAHPIQLARFVPTAGDPDR